MQEVQSVQWDTTIDPAISGLQGRIAMKPPQLPKCHAGMVVVRRPENDGKVECVCCSVVRGTGEMDYKVI
jgi:hypothetical protein